MDRQARFNDHRDDSYVEDDEQTGTAEKACEEGQKPRKILVRA